MSEPATIEDCDCTRSLRLPEGEVCAFDADSDIAGIGILLSFIIVACATEILVVYMRYTILWTKPSSPAALKTLQRVFLTFNDQQLVTGFAILVIGYSQITTISEYHLAIVTSLATLSFLVQDSAAEVVGICLSGPYTSIARKWRGTATICFMAMTLIAQFPMGNRYWLDSFGMPARCLFQQAGGNYDPGTSHFWRMVVYMSLMLWGILSTLASYFPGTIVWAKDRRAAKIMYIIVRPMVLLPRRCHYKSLEELQYTKSAVHHMAWTLLRKLSFLVAAFIFALSELVREGNMGWSRDWILLCDSVGRILGWRSRAGREGRTGNESEWSFGQMVPVILLALPLISLGETAYEIQELRRKARTDARPQDGRRRSSISLDDMALTQEPEGMDSTSGGETTESNVVSSSELRHPRRRLDTEDGGSLSEPTSAENGGAPPSAQDCVDYARYTYFGLPAENQSTPIVPRDPTFEQALQKSNGFAWLKISTITLWHSSWGILATMPWELT